MPLVDFISSNPAIDEFNRANKVADDRTTQDLANKTAAFKLQTDQAEAPLKLKQLTADTAFAGTRAETAAAAAPYAGPKAAAEVASTRASTANTISEMNQRTAKLHMDAFTQQLELLDRGDVEGAKRVAASVNDTLPDAIINNSQARAAMKNITAQAQQSYPNRPRDQMMFIHAHVHEIDEMQKRGQTVNPQTAPYQEVPGAPEIPVQGGQTQGETERIISSLRQENPSLSYADAVGIAKRAPDGDTVALRKETLALIGAKVDSSYLDNPIATLEEWRQRYGLQTQMGGAPGAPPQRPQSVPQGSAFSPSRNQWRDPQGNLYDANGQRVAAAPAAAGPQAPSPPLSQ